MNDHAPEVTVLMPCLNEAETLAGCIEAARRGLAAAGAEGEILIADNGSTDRSREIAATLGARVVRVAEKGYGNALRAGMAAAAGRIIVMGDADQSYDFAAIGPLVSKLRDGADLVMGCRMPAGGGTIEPGAMPWKHRWIGNPVLTWFGRLFFRSHCHDFHCGLRALTKDAFVRLQLRTGGMEFASEMVVKASLLGLRVEEVPITLYRDQRSRRPHLRSWRDGWRHLRFLLLFSPRWLFFYPGLFLALVGAVPLLVLLRGSVTLGGIHFDVHTMEIAAMALSVGYQMILFSTFARIYAHTHRLLPPSPFIRGAFRWFTLERGLLGGMLLAFAGGVAMAGVFIRWAQGGFGDLDPAESIRPIIAGRTAVVLGCQTFLFSFLFSYLGLDDPGNGGTAESATPESDDPDGAGPAGSSSP